MAIFCSCFLCPSSFPSIWEFPLPGSLACIYYSPFFCTPHIFSLCFRFPLRNIPLRFLTRAPEFTTREFNPEAEDSVQSTVLSSKAISRTVVYYRAFRKWKDFVTSKFHSCARPTSPGHVALHLQHLFNDS